MTTATQVPTPSPATNKAQEKSTSMEGRNKPAYSGKPSALSIAYEKKMAEIDSRIEASRKRLDGLREGGGGGGKKSGEEEKRTALLEELRRTRDEMRPHQDQRRRLQEQLGKIREDIEKKTGQNKEAKDKLPFRSVADMESRVRELEAQIETGQFRLAEEKQILSEISKLKKARRALESLDENASDVGTMRLRMEKIRSDIGAQDTILAQKRQQTDQIRQKLDELNGVRAEQQAQRQDKQALIDKAKKELDEAYGERRSAYEEYRAAKKAAADARERRMARQAEMDRRRELEEKIEDLEEKLLAFRTETATDRKISECNNIKAFFQSLLLPPTNKGEEEQEKKTAASSSSSSNRRQVKLSEELADAVAINKKDDDENFFFAPSNKKTTTSKHHSAPGSSSATAVSLGKLPLHILNGLADLRLPIPSTPSDLEALFAAIDDRQKGFLSQQDDSRLEVEKKRQALADQIDGLKKDLEQMQNSTTMAKPQAKEAEHSKANGATQETD